MQTRREFLATSTAAVIAASTGFPKDKDQPKMIPIIDTHQHLWDLSKFKLAWVKEGHPLNASYTPKEYATATEGLNVVKAVYMEVDVVEEQQQAEADYLMELIKSKTTPTVAAVISGRPAKDNFKKYVDQFKGSPVIKGIRQVLHVDSTPSGFPTKKEFIAGVRHLGEIGLSFDLCMRSVDLPDAIKLVEECPDTRFILDHCGNGGVHATTKDREQWKKDMTTLGKKKNLVCKVSGFIASSSKGKWKVDDLAPIINHTIESFGWDRVMFGGDWPVCTLAATYQQWVNALKEIVKDRKEEEQKKLFHDNAAKFYGI